MMMIDHPHYDRSQQQVQDTAQDEKRLPDQSSGLPLSLYVTICVISGMLTLRYGYLLLRCAAHRLDTGNK